MGELLDEFPGQKRHAQRMREARVPRRRVDVLRRAELLQAPQALELCGIDHGDAARVQLDVAEDGVVKDFGLVRWWWCGLRPPVLLLEAGCSGSSSDGSMPVRRHASAERGVSRERLTPVSVGADLAGRSRALVEDMASAVSMARVASSVGTDEVSEASSSSYAAAATRSVAFC